MSNLPPEEFINKKVKIIFEPMISQMLIDKPSDPVNSISIKYKTKY
jgi:hypothetical protein